MLGVSDYLVWSRICGLSLRVCKANCFSPRLYAFPMFYVDALLPVERLVEACLLVRIVFLHGRYLFGLSFGLVCCVLLIWWVVDGVF